ncbi:MAG: T9SS type A sorting domain-containing protein [Ignavibacteriae bacterium]|nr:T9SS type A sorting domain-containing protein [Ignavibacteriota bacterium]
MFFLLFAVSASNGQWTVKQLPTTERLTDIFFADTLSGWITSFGGTFHTTDGGIRWALQDSSATWHIVGISSEQCWVTTRRVVKRTTDGGSTWNEISLNIPSDSIDFIGSICFVDTLRGWIAGYSRSAENFLFRTTDGGRSWSMTRPSIGSGLYLCSFVDHEVGWLAGLEWNAVFQTSDGGNTWRRFDSVYTLQIINMQFLTRSLGWISADGSGAVTIVRKTTNGGHTWDRQFIFDCSDLTTFFHFPDTLNGWLAQFTCIHGDHLEIWHTSTGGDNWEKQWEYYPDFYFRPRRVFFLDAKHGWIVGENGIAFSTINGGVTSLNDERSFMPQAYKLFQNYPNPFNSTTMFRYDLTERGMVQLAVYDLLGRLVKSLVSQVDENGEKIVSWDGRNNTGDELPSGIYICRMRVEGIGGKRFESTRKAVLLR